MCLWATTKEFSSPRLAITIKHILFQGFPVNQLTMSVYISIARFKQFIASVEKTMTFRHVSQHYKLYIETEGEHFLCKSFLFAFFASNSILKVLSDKFLPCGSAFLNALPASIKFVAASCLLCI